MRSTNENGARRLVTEASTPVRLRICMPTSRKLTKKAFQCGIYEAQDVLRATDDVDLIALEPGPAFRMVEPWHRRLLFRDVSRELIFQNPGLKKRRLDSEYDLFLAVCQNHWDLPYINAIEGWRDRCKVAVCWIHEMWAAQLPRYKYWIHALRQFDHVFLSCRDSVAPLAKATGVPCSWLPGGVDAIRFNPFPNPPSRVVDVYSIGRRWEGIHRALLNAAGCKDLFYFYDTFPGADMEPYDHQQHRDLIASVAKRSRCFMVAPAKMDTPGDTCGQVEIGARYYEGAAAGAVLIGLPPICDAYKEMFPWTDAVIPIQPDGSDVIEVLAKLRSDPERVLHISLTNATQSLARHDWIYRWMELLRVAGMDPAPGMLARVRRLKDLAALCNASDLTSLWPSGRA
jgi:hypothetical protein